MTQDRSVRLDQWELLDFDPGAGSAEAGTDWMPVGAPGDAYQALIAAGRLPHPFQGRNETSAAWVRDREWWQRTTFVAPFVGAGETAELVFDGLDTFAEIFVDGELVGSADNMFRIWRFTLAGLQAGSTHTLAVRFNPPGQSVGPATMPVWNAFTDRVSRSRRNQMRKAQFGWGWDWGPDLPTVGIWQPVRIELRSTARLDDVRFTTLKANADLAEAEIRYSVSGPLDTGSLRVEVALRDPEGAAVFETTQTAFGNAPLPVRIPNPRLWWTADLGEPALHALSVRLYDGDRLLDAVDKSVGLRTIALDQSPDPDEPGATFFRFVLNGAPIFAKGACWVPTTSFVADVEADRYRQLIDQAAGANMNMIRVWGGGIYEPDLFYDLCDRAGLLVWQDFMFACAHYPDDAAFHASVRAEAEDQVRRLRHHACLAMWCGNNENQAINRFNNDLAGEDTPLGGLAIYDHLLPEVLGALDPTTPYRTSSPFGGGHPNSMREGDVHDWTVWHGVPLIPGDEMTGEYARTPEGLSFKRYAEDTARFVSEFGLQAAPAMATLERWMDAADLTPDSEGFLERIKDEARKADAMMIPETGLPTTLHDYVDFTQWCQAEGLKFGIEHFRRRRPQCSGALLWQFNDCWPCVSWSLVDFDGVEKAAYQAVRRAFAPVLASFRTTSDGAVELWITNDTLQTVSGEAVLALESLGGDRDWLETLPFSAEPDGHAVVWRGHAPGGDDRVLRVWSPDEIFEPNRLLSSPIARLALTPGARPKVSIIAIGPNELRVELQADAYLAFVHLVSERADVRFSDNHFDLAAGERRGVTVTAGAALGPHDIDVRCWNARTA